MQQRCSNAAAHTPLMMGRLIVRDKEAQGDVEKGGRVSLRIAQKLTEQETSLKEARELLERRDALMHELESTHKNQEAGIFEERFAKLFEVQRLNDLARENLFPPDPPNHFCWHATVGGILFYNTAGLKCGDYKRLFEFGKETAYVWTHTPHQFSVLIVEVDEQVHEQNIWKTLGSCLRIAMAFHSNLEGMQPAENFEYSWIYHFSPDEPLKEQSLLNSDSISSYGVDRSSVNQPLRFLEEIAPTLELLGRHERYFVASQHLVASVESHYFCLVCALQREGYKRHPNHEPEIWEVVETIPKMEMAIVQATRAVEAVLGQPGRRENPKKLARTVERWKSVLDLNPQESFELTGKSYLDYYYDLFEIRGGAAHSLGKLPYEVSRQLTMEAQCFAWIILWQYLGRHSLDRQAAAEALRLDQAIYASEPENFFTKMTNDPE